MRIVRIMVLVVTEPAFAALAIVAAVLWFWLAAVVEGQSRTEWVNKACFTNGCIAETLNGLSPDRAAEAKITTWRDTSYVWYRK